MHTRFHTKLIITDAKLTLHCVYNVVADKLSETVHLMLNDPSMGLYRIQEHVKRSVPNLVEKKVDNNVK